MDKGKLLNGACSHQKHKGFSRRETFKKPESQERWRLNTLLQKKRAGFPAPDLKGWCGS